MSAPALPLLGILLLAAPLAARGNVYVVDKHNGPGTDFVDLAAAVDGSTPNDVLLMRSGVYPTLFINGAPRRIIADTGADVSFSFSGFIQNIPAGATMVLSGIRIDMLGNFSESLILKDNAGTILLQDCSFAGGQVSVFSSPETVLIEECDRVVLARCTIQGANVLGSSSGALEGTGIKTRDSSVHLYDCTVTGGNSLPSMSGVAPAGAPGIDVDGGSLFASGGSITGGPGGPGGSLPTCFDGGAGGPGIRLRTNAPVVRMLDVALAGGQGGAAPGGGGGCVAGPMGPPSQVLSGSLAMLPGSAHSLTSANPIREGVPTPTVFEGVAGEAVWWLFSGAGTASFDPALSGTIVVASPVSAVFAGVIGGSGSKSIPVNVNVPASTEAIFVVEQAVFLDFSSGMATLSSPMAVALLQSGF